MSSHAYTIDITGDIVIDISNRHELPVPWEISSHDALKRVCFRVDGFGMDATVNDLIRQFDAAKAASKSPCKRRIRSAHRACVVSRGVTGLLRLAACATAVGIVASALFCFII